MSDRGFPISRRTLLRGAGAALGLPWLEAMMPSRLPAATTAPARPTRLAALFMPNGVRADRWTPAGEGRQFQLSPTLEPLSDLRDDILVLTNLWNQGSDFGDGHYVKTSGFLTCTTINKTLGIDLNCNGVSMDQVAARSVANQTPLPSLELGIEPVSIGVDRNVGYTRVYGSHIAWSGPTRPMAREIHPRLVYERLFRASRPQSDAAQRDVLLLDRVHADAKRLRKRLGDADRQRMDEFLQSVRSLEQRLERASQPSQYTWRPLAPLDPDQKPPSDAPDQHATHVRLMMDMMALAFQTDTTRVCTFMFGNAVSGTNFSFLDGVRGSHHGLSHHQGDEDKLEQYQQINRWHVEQFAYLLGKLRQMSEADGSVLDHSMVLFGSGLRDGNSHNPHNLPIVLGGRGGGRIATGQHLVFGKDTPLANLYVAMLQAFGAQVDRFADSTERLPGVLA